MFADRQSVIRLVWLLLPGILLSGSVSAGSNAELAEAFGRLPEMWDVRPSPDGSEVSMLHMLDKEDMPVALVMDRSGGTQGVVASKKDKFDLDWCAWANSSRLLCGAHGIAGTGSKLYSETRLLAVDSDGTARKVMLQDRLQRKGQFGQFQDEVIDWLPDDPQHVLISLPSTTGTGVARVDISTGRVEIDNKQIPDIWEWVSDGRGHLRVRLFMDTGIRRWQYLDREGKWKTLHESAMDDLDDRFSIAGFGADANELLVFQPYQGRLALWAVDVSQDEPAWRLVYQHPEVDLNGVLRMGKYRRVVAVSYVTERAHYEFFDARVMEVTATLASAFPGKRINVIDESWDGRTWLIWIGSSTDPGHYSLFVPEQRSLVRLPPIYPALADRELAPMRPVEFTARDGVKIPGYLTEPVGQRPASGWPTVILPHGGPQSRDILGFDWLVQFFAAKGYAVLQVNFRGSGGYGETWAGEGGFRAWRRTIADITDGAKYLLDEGVSAPGRSCIVGWSYGGYAALMSAIENPGLYNCVASIAGVVDPKMLIDDRRIFLNKKAVEAFVGRGDEVFEQGSPLRRAGEIDVPVLLFHGDEDINVPVRHSRALHKRLKKLKKPTDLVIYDDAEHSLWSNRARIDMLSRLGKFLDRNTPVVDPELN